MGNNRLRRASNVLVVIAVVIAAYIKWSGDGAEIFFKENDVYIIAGIGIGYLLLRRK